MLRTRDAGISYAEPSLLTKLRQSSDDEQAGTSSDDEPIDSRAHLTEGELRNLQQDVRHRVLRAAVRVTGATTAIRAAVRVSDGAWDSNAARPIACAPPRSCTNASPPTRAGREEREVGGGATGVLCFTPCNRKNSYLRSSYGWMRDDPGRVLSGLYFCLTVHGVILIWHFVIGN